MTRCENRIRTAAFQRCVFFSSQKGARLEDAAIYAYRIRISKRSS